MVDFFRAHEKRYTYLEPIWPILENNPHGITLDKLVEQSGLDKDKMLKKIERLAIEYNKASQLLFVDGRMAGLIEAAYRGDKAHNTLAKEMAKSWIFDKVMLYARVKELDWTDQVVYPELLEKMKEMWLQTKGA